MEPLTLAETASMAASIRGSSFEPTLDETFYSESEGNPLFVAEMARTRALHQDINAQTAMLGPQPLLTRASSTLPRQVQLF